MRIMLNNNQYIEILTKLQEFPDQDLSQFAKEIMESYLLFDI